MIYTSSSKKYLINWLIDEYIFINIKTTNLYKIHKMNIIL